MKRATAGLALEGACRVVRDDDPRALAAAAEHLIGDEQAAAVLRRRAQRYLAVHHSNEWFSTALRQLLGEPEPSLPAKPTWLPPPTAPAPPAG